jgi:GalNAc-alpha-(1->4)-GalNAc-alpha-(1->3)-diNAcBac-PP-undecaprenol alpha-1,4-N-acetyl-D-galactosaminyltransferase
MRITWVIATVSEAGGAQRVLAATSNYWAQEGWQVTVLTYDDGSKPPFFEIHPDVRIVPMNTGRPYAGIIKAFFRNIGRIFALRKEIIKSSPFCVIAMGDIDGIRSILAVSGLKIPVVVLEQVEPAQLGLIKNGWIWNALRRLVYPFAASIVVLTEAGKNHFGRRLRDKIAIIPNPVPDLSFTPHKDDRLPDISASNCLVTAGRLVRQKRIDLLLEAYSQIVERVDADLFIAGDGPLRGELEKLRDDLGLSERVRFIGSLKNPWATLNYGKIFVMSSEFEGFPLALLEAMACGLPVVSFDCPTGPGEIIRHGIDGLLIPPLEVSALAKEIELLLNDEPRRKLMAERALEVKERFGLDAVMGLWEDLICRRLGGTKAVGDKACAG